MNRWLAIALVVAACAALAWYLVTEKQTLQEAQAPSRVGTEAVSSEGVEAPSGASVADQAESEATADNHAISRVSEPAAATEGTGAEALAATQLLGIVRSESGEPIPGAEVLLVNESLPSTPTGSAITSSSGDFSIPNPPKEGVWSVLADAAGFVRGGRTGLEAADFHRRVEVVLSREAQIRGRIIENLTGNPIPEATVSLRLDNAAPPLDQIWEHIRPGVARPESDGRYILGDLLPDTDYDLVCASPVHLPREREAVPSGSTGIDFILDRGGTVHGTVLVENTGEGVNGAEVTLWSQDPPESRRTVAAADGGEFLIQGLPFGEYRVRAEWGELSSHARPDQGAPVSLSGSNPEKSLILLLKQWPVGVLSGTVRDIENSGVLDAQVDVMELPERTLRFRAKTDTWGRYRIEGIYGGDYRVQAHAEALYTDERGLRMVDGEVRKDFDFIMIPGFMISGRVTLPDGKTGVADAGIGTEGRRRRESMPGTESGADGSYAFGPVPAGEYVLQVRPPEGYIAEEGEGARQVSVTDGDVEDVDFIVKPAASISGQVVSATGPVEGALVTLATALETPERIPTYEGSVRTDPSGLYTLIAVPEDLVYSVVVRSEGYAGHVSDIETMRGSEPVEHPTIRLAAPGATILGSVQMANGSSPPPLGVTAGQSDLADLYRRGDRWRGSALTRGTRVGSEGRFALAGLSAGTWQVSLQAPRFMEVDPQTVDLAPNGEAVVEFIIGATSEGTATISGHVRFADGSPAAGYRVRAMAFREREFMSAVTDQSGYFLVQGLTEGREYRLEAQAPDVEFWRYTPGPTQEVVAPADGVELIYELDGKITGRVMDSNGGRVANYEIQLEREGGRRGFRRGGFGSIGTVETMPGVYVVHDVAPGRYRVEGYAPELAPAQSDWVEVEPARVTEGVDLVFDSGATLRGHVLEDGTNDPVPGTRVYTRAGRWFRGAPEDFVEQSTYTDAEGRFTLEHLPRGSIWLAARHGLYADEFQRDIEIPAEGEPEEITIYLTLGGTIEGDVLDSAGVGIPGQDVMVRRRWDETPAVTDAGGHFALTRLPEGEYSVRWRSYHQHVEVVTGETASVLIQEATE